MKARRWGSTTAAVVRELANADQPLMQRELADRCHTSQPRVSQILAMLAEAGLVYRSPGGWWARPARLVDVYLDRYRPREVEPEAWWYALDTLAEQVRRITGAHHRTVVSADLATDMTTPWRRPSAVVIWTPVPLDLRELRFVPAESRAAATIVLRTTDDQRMLADAETVDGLPLASRLQQATDLLDLGGSDRVEAAAILLDTSGARSR